MTQHHVSPLGESPIWNVNNKSWFYVDILEGRILAKAGASLTIVKEGIPYVSNIVGALDGFLVTAGSKIFVCDEAFNQFDVIHELTQPSSMRTNDGAVGPDGKYWFGTMEKEPTGANGEIYSIDPSGELVSQSADIGIPNSFVWLDEHQVLISDSYIQKTYKVQLLENGKLDWKNKQTWLDLSDTDGTPDGAALDIEGNIWMAIWGSAAIHKYSKEGVLLDVIALDALQPTSCAFGGENLDQLMITTATDGMTEEQLRLYPDSGRVLQKCVNVKGHVLPKFNLEV